MSIHHFKPSLAAFQLVAGFLRSLGSGARLRAACVAAVLSVSLTPAALATPTISWTFAPDFHLSDPSGAVDIRGTLLNTGSETIVAVNFLQIYYGTLGPYITSWVWNATFWDDYYTTNIDVDPGETFDFYIATVSYDNAPTGLYTAVSNAAIGVLSEGGVYSGAVAPDNDLLVQVPEPSAAALALAALLGLGLVRRRRSATES